ncbi:MAG: hypothetical protein GY757_07985, partial [bacterium]|nr:hypothetical protein [bacterium]
MGFLSKRRQSYQRLLKELEALLIKNSVTPCYLFKETNILNYLTCIPFNSVLNRLKITTVNVNLTEEEKKFVKFIQFFRQARKNSSNLLLETPVPVSHHDSPPIGWRENKSYQKELEQYKIKLEEYQHKKEILDKKKELLWQTPGSEIFEYVQQEERAALC